MVFSENLISQFSTVAMASSFVGPVSRLDSLRLGSLSMTWTGTPTGTLSLELSNEDVPSSPSDASFDTISGSSLSIAGAAGQQTWNFNMAYYAKWFRVRWVATSGSGTLTAFNLTVKTEGN
jgi:hypothetical protein